ncbi:hypothetical protein FGO68_gene10644 [Halteria grandinella]|uniref:RING-type E3 ubiquitin transferase n=1 Tax=Halteria grandinella TaxID=5974 RepID=A0A8J8NTY0_HALGN|nr:hypothetical protein FGO68_gene10644 [Halteria grandinella]
MKAKVGDLTCCICFEELSDEVMIRETPCQHIFHSECIMEWIKAKFPKPDCPYCREEFKSDSI